MKNKEERRYLRWALHVAKITKERLSYYDSDAVEVSLDEIIYHLEIADKQIRDTIIKRAEK